MFCVLFIVELTVYVSVVKMVVVTPFLGCEIAVCRVPNGRPN